MTTVRITKLVDFSKLDPISSDGGHISKDQARHVEKYCRKILKKLQIPMWKVWVAKDISPENTQAMISPTDGRRIAMLYLSENWWSETDAEDKRTCLTHEMLHLIHHDQEEVIRRFKNTTGDISTYAMSLVWEQFRVETERMVDQLSYVIAPNMPEWKSTDASE